MSLRRLDRCFKYQLLYRPILGFELYSLYDVKTMISIVYCHLNDTLYG
jgi:hypothetical protein